MCTSGERIGTSSHRIGVFKPFHCTLTVENEWVVGQDPGGSLLLVILALIKESYIVFMFWKTHGNVDKQGNWKIFHFTI